MEMCKETERTECADAVSECMQLLGQAVRDYIRHAGGMEGTCEVHVVCVRCNDETNTKVYMNV